MLLGIVPLPPNLAGGAAPRSGFSSTSPNAAGVCCVSPLPTGWRPHSAIKTPARRKPSVRAVFSLQKVPTSLSFFSPGPDARPPPPRVIAAQPRDPDHDRARRSHLAVPVALARDSDQREEGASGAGRRARRGTLSSRRGSPPASEEALVGPYLDHLPDDGNGPSSTTVQCRKSMSRRPQLWTRQSEKGKSPPQDDLTSCRRIYRPTLKAHTRPLSANKYRSNLSHCSAVSSAGRLNNR